MSGLEPEVSVIIPAYRSDATIKRSLSTMRLQTLPSYEIIVVDSSPDDSTAQIVEKAFPDVRYVRSPERLLPHAARNRGVSLARGRLLVFTDPDIYAPSDWLENLVSAYRRFGGTISGALTCYEDRPIEVGMHFCKFDKWLPGGVVRRIDIAATANMLCDRDTFEAIGGFADDSMLADAIMSRRLGEEHVPIWFVPGAVVAHHHFGGWQALLRERYQRGREFGQLRLGWEDWSARRVLIQALCSLIPIRLAKLVLRGLINAWRAGMLRDYLKVSPVAVAGQAAWLAGEAVAYGTWLKGGGAKPNAYPHVDSQHGGARR